MLEQCKLLIRNNWTNIIKECRLQDLSKKLINSNVFTEKEINEIFSTTDERHNKRVFLFKIMQKEQFAFDCFLQALADTNYQGLAKFLKSQSGVITHNCTPTIMPIAEIEPEILSEAEIQAHVNNRVTPLQVRVKHSKEFQDTEENCRGLEFYSSRSKNRGKVLIINNYDFSLSRQNKKDHIDRMGALVDKANLKQLFEQLGGWTIEEHDNRTAQEILTIVKSFCSNENGNLYDIIFVIIMSHGQEELNESTIVGIDGAEIYTSDIEDHFTNRNCTIFKGKPKVFLYQTCRGIDIDIAVRYATESDGKIKPKKLLKIEGNLRNMEDMLIGYSTLQGHRAHRDINRGSWYIESICDIFMEQCCNLPVDDLLSKVDQKLRKTMSERLTMQTSEIYNRGFKKLFLNPGIYSDNGIIQKYF